VNNTRAQDDTLSIMLAPPPPEKKKKFKINWATATRRNHAWWVTASKVVQSDLDFVRRNNPQCHRLVNIIPGQSAHPVDPITQYTIQNAILCCAGKHFLTLRHSD
jgi:hypothetical protein